MAEFRSRENNYLINTLIVNSYRLSFLIVELFKSLTTWEGTAIISFQFQGEKYKEFFIAKIADTSDSIASNLRRYSHEMRAIDKRRP